MPYGADLATFLSSDYRFSLDGTLVGEVGGLTITNTGGVTTGSAICLDVSNSYVTNGTSDRGTIPTTGTIDAASGSFAFCYWIRLTKAQLPFCRSFGLGNNTQSRSVVIGAGNAVIWEADNGTFEAQRYSDRNLQANRNYHITWIWDSNGLRAFLDGVEQTNGNDFSQSSVTLNAATPIEIGDPAGSVSLGGFTIVLVAPVNQQMNELHFFDPSGVTDQEIFDELFAKGAIAEYTVTNQTQLDAIANTICGDYPVSIRVDVSGSISLDADNITFNDLASCHVHYTGTGTLTWTNSNGSTASIGSAPDGSIVFNNPATLTIEGLINGCEIRIYDDETLGDGSHNTELDGTETLSGTTFNFSHSGATNDIVIQMIAAGYVEIKQNFTLGSSDQTLTLFPQVETNA